MSQRDFTLHLAGHVPDGTPLEAYNGADVGFDSSGAPQGPVAAAATVTDGEATFADLTPSLYVAYGLVDGEPVYIKFPVNEEVEAGG
jgi:hypothetical protein